MFDLFRVVWISGLQAGRPLLGLRVDERIVEEEQRLGRHCRPQTLGRRGVRVRSIEQREERMPLEPLRHEINAPLVVVVDRAEWSVLRVAPIDRRREGMLRRR